MEGTLVRYEMVKRMKVPTRICWMRTQRFYAPCVPHQCSSTFLFLCIPYLYLRNEQMDKGKCKQCTVSLHHVELKD